MEGGERERGTRLCDFLVYTGIFLPYIIRPSWTKAAYSCKLGLSRNT